MEVRALHSWNLSYREAVRLQEELAPRLILRGGPRRIRLVAGADLSYSKGSDRFYCVVLLLRGGSMEIVDQVRVSGRSRFPYVPGLLSFREAPFLVRAFRKLCEAPDVVFFDGQGIAHPRGFGLASHMGLLLDLPSIGCAKSLLVGQYDEPGMKEGLSTPLRHQGRTVGTVLRTRRSVKPIFVSPGHRIGLRAAARITLACCSKFRIPEPTRLAHIAVTRFRIEKESGSWKKRK